MLGAKKFNCLFRKFCWPLLIPLRATINALPTTTINIVRADLAFLSLRASKDNMKICLIFLLLCFLLFLLIIELWEEECLWAFTYAACLPPFLAILITLIPIPPLLSLSLFSYHTVLCYCIWPQWSKVSSTILIAVLDKGIRSAILSVMLNIGLFLILR